MPIARGTSTFIGWMATLNGLLLWWCRKYSLHACHQWFVWQSISVPSAKWLYGSHEVTSRFFSKIIGMPTLKARRCGGIPARIMVLRDSVPIAIAYSSPISTESADKNTCSCLGTTLVIWVSREFTIVFFVVRIAWPSMYPWFA